MSHFSFKKITAVPAAKDFKEIVLSKTQRKTPTVIHKHYAISRIRQFYIRKIKFAQQTIHDKLTEIIQEFPKLDDVHPFYSDLMNILYDKDHYKIALGQMSTARHLVDGVTREYVRLMKYSDSLYRCKMLKRAALGRFMKVIRKQKSSFEYLEQVRMHLQRLPSIDPNTRAAVIYILDVSEMCNQTVEQQLALFENIRPLFVNKPVMLAVNKVDIRRIADLPQEQRVLFDKFAAEDIPVIEMSTVSKEGIIELRDKACDRLLAQRVESKLRAKGNNAASLISRIHIAMPKPRDDVERVAFIPEAVRTRREARLAGHEPMMTGKRLEKHIEEEEGDDYALDLKKNYLLANHDEKYDRPPEIWEGHNLADFVCEDIMEKLELLREEERLREEAGVYDIDFDSDDEDIQDIRRKARLIRRKQLIATQSTRRKKMSTKPVMPARGRKRERSAARFEATMSDLGVDVSTKRMKHLTETNEQRGAYKKVKVGQSHSRSGSRPAPRDQLGVNKKIMPHVTKVKLSNQKPRQRLAKKGEGDRKIPDLKPKHLFAGKRKAGKTQRR